jgi:hypothetical protein
MATSGQTVLLVKRRMSFVRMNSSFKTQKQNVSISILSRNEDIAEKRV